MYIGWMAITLGIGPHSSFSYLASVDAVCQLVFYTNMNECYCVYSLYCIIQYHYNLLWPPYGIRQGIIFLSCGFFLWPSCVADADIIFLSCFFFFLSFLA